MEVGILGEKTSSILTRDLDPDYLVLGGTSSILTAKGDKLQADASATVLSAEPMDAPSPPPPSIAKTSIKTAPTPPPLHKTAVKSEPAPAAAPPVGRAADSPSQIMEMESPGGRCTLEFAPGRFLRLKMKSAGFTAKTLSSLIGLVIFFSMIAAFNQFWLIIFPLIFVVPTLLRLGFSEELYRDRALIRHNLNFLSVLSIKNSHVPSSNLRILSENVILTQRSSKAIAGKAPPIYIVGKGWRERIGYSLDANEGDWMRQTLASFLNQLYGTK